MMLSLALIVIKAVTTVMAQCIGVLSVLGALSIVACVFVGGWYLAPILMSWASLKIQGVVVSSSSVAEVEPVCDREVTSRSVTPKSLGLSTLHVGRRNWRIVQDTVDECRNQLGLDRHTDPADPAVRQLVRRTVFGILSDSKAYPDLRRTDVNQLCPLISEMALTPTESELVALEVATSAPMQELRKQAFGTWYNEGTSSRSWFGFVWRLLGREQREVYLPAVQRPQSF